MLVAAWLEAAPTVFSSFSTSRIAESPALELLQIVFKLSIILWRSLVRRRQQKEESNVNVTDAWLDQHLQQLLKHLMAYFPYGADSVERRPGKVFIFCIYYANIKLIRL